MTLKNWVIARRMASRKYRQTALQTSTALAVLAGICFAGVGGTAHAACSLAGGVLSCIGTSNATSYSGNNTTLKFTTGSTTTIYSGYEFQGSGNTIIVESGAYIDYVNGDSPGYDGANMVYTFNGTLVSSINGFTATNFGDLSSHNIQNLKFSFGDGALVGSPTNTSLLPYGAFQFVGNGTAVSSNVTANFGSGQIYGRGRGVLEVSNINSAYTFVGTTVHAGTATSAGRALELSGGVDNVFTIRSGADFYGTTYGIGMTNERSGQFNITDSTIRGGRAAIQTAGSAGDVNTFTLNGATILGGSSGAILGGNGNELYTLTNSNVTGNVALAAGADLFILNGGTLIGALDMGADDDIAAFLNHSDVSMAAIPLIDGGLGSDTLTFNNTSFSRASALVNWEQIDLTNTSRLTLDGNLVLGDTGTLTGGLSIDSSSVLYAGNSINPSITPFTSGNPVTLTNAGTIDLTNGGGATTNSLTVVGNYIGQGGRIILNTYLGGDGALSDRLIINGGTATGSTTLLVNSTVGNGELTVHDGILVVQATNGATTDPTAFHLGNRVAAGAYEYRLFYGGEPETGGDPNDQNWYLRNTTTNSPTVPIIRPEVPVSTAIQPLVIEYGYALLDTLHERVGETYLNLSDPVTEERVVWCKDPATNFKCKVRVPVANSGKDETRWARSGWARLIGDRGFHEPNNFLRRGPNYDYTFGGIQAGLDIYAREQADGTLDKAGIYVGYGQIASNVKGQSGGKAGTVDIDAYTLGGYWTHHSSQGWYTDAVVQGTWHSVDAHSIHGQHLKPEGFAILGSLEAGYAFKLGNGFTLEPQAQIVYQYASLDDARDAYGFVRFDDDKSLRGRLGVRLTKSWNMADQAREPRLVTAWLRANVWHEFMGKTTTSWGALGGQNMTPFHSYLTGTWGEIGAGVTAQVSDTVNIFTTGAYHRSLDNKGREGWDGRLGMTVKW